MDSSSELTLFYRGAEADLYTFEIGPLKAVLKKRVRKVYRSSDLDKRIRKERTAREALAMHTAKHLGVRAPTLLEVNSDDCSIRMTFIPGASARTALDSIGPPDSRVILRDLGSQVGLLHGGEIVHGDLTTSNIIIDSSLKTHLVDFGMSSHTSEAEDMGVDLHLLERSIATSHSNNTRTFMRAFSKGYAESAGIEQAHAAFKKAMIIGKRGRYFALR